MLVVLSDLHLNDGSASPENVSAAAFGEWFAEVQELVLETGEDRLEILFLGDIYDLIRTEFWFYPAPGRALPADAALTIEDETFPLADRPWGAEPITALCAERAAEIAVAVARASNDQLAFLSGETSRLSQAFRAREAGLVARVESGARRLAESGVSVRRLYMPGNHDRLFLVVPAVRSTILASLGAEEIGPLYEDSRHGVVARHGHEHDPWNFDETRERCPIGDPITTELVTRFAYETWRELDGKVPAALRDEVYEHLRHVEDVRPMHACFKWIECKKRELVAATTDDHDRAISHAIRKSLLRVMNRFTDIPYVRTWMERGRGAWKLLLVRWIYRLFGLGALRRLLELADWLAAHGIGNEDPLADAAHDERETARHVVYGHTHEYRHDPLDDRRVYINSGTWRPFPWQTRDGKGFTTVDKVVYLVFRGDASYETWVSDRRAG